VGITDTESLTGWADRLHPDELRARLLVSNCAGPVRVRFLGPNNNNKNQIYLGGDLSDLNWMPKGPQVSALRTSAKAVNRSQPLGHSSLDFHWLTPTGTCRAPHAQLINYPQYPEVRLSGLLRGSPNAPTDLLSVDRRGKVPGRVLILAVRGGTEVVGLVVSPESRIAAYLRLLLVDSTERVLHCWDLLGPVTQRSRNDLLSELCRIHRLGLVPGERLLGDGTVVPYDAPNAGGYTLERHLGVPSNARNEPDFLGWEVKQHDVHSSRVTIFDVMPDRGRFAELPAQEFFERFGRRTGENRFDFNGVARVGADPDRPLGLALRGFVRGVLEADGAVELRAGGEVLMSWSFLRLSDRWASKHQRAVYVSSDKAVVAGRRCYRYHPNVELAEGARFRRFIEAVAEGRIVADPACRLIRSDRGAWVLKARSAFRVRPSDVTTLYSMSESRLVCGAETHQPA
jgi:hypothetical protein